ncbi:MAG TPA: hypothetical protein VKK81_20135 [Candidatus Binatia bacterium]|nr:hypothetical protein [Candidatus Binatia bacterium]
MAGSRGEVRRLPRASPQGRFAGCHLQPQWARLQRERFPSIGQLLHEFPAKAAVLDGEVVASDADG